MLGLLIPSNASARTIKISNPWLEDGRIYRICRATHWICIRTSNHLNFSVVFVCRMEEGVEEDFIIILLSGIYAACGRRGI